MKVYNVSYGDVLVCLHQFLGEGFPWLLVTSFFRKCSHIFYVAILQPCLITNLTTATVPATAQMPDNIRNSYTTLY